MQSSGELGSIQSFFTFWNGDDNMAWDANEWNEIDVEIVPTLGDWAFNTNIIY